MIEMELKSNKDVVEVVIDGKFLRNIGLVIMRVGLSYTQC